MKKNKRGKVNREQNDLNTKSSEQQNASATRGGTTDMDRAASTETPRHSAGSGLSSKSGVTGSDYDGQVTDR